MDLKLENEALFYLNKLINYYSHLKVYTIAHALYERSKIYMANKLNLYAIEDLKHSQSILDEINNQPYFEDPLCLNDNIRITLKHIALG